MKSKLLVALALFFQFAATAQVGINNTNPKAVLDITASNPAAPVNTDGILIPRIDAFPTTNPGVEQQGMLVYLTTTVGTNTPGFYYWDNTSTSWVAVLGAKNTLDQAYDQGGAGAGRSITADNGAVKILGNGGLIVRGKVGIGTFFQDAYNLSVSTNLSNYSTQIKGLGRGLKVRLYYPSSVNGFYYIGFHNSGDLISGNVRVASNGIGVAYNTISDRRLKTNIVSINNSLQIIDKIQPKRYEYKANRGIKEYGFIAQELQKVYPQAVSGDPNGNVKKDPMMVDYSRLTPILTAGVKELHNKVENLEKENKELKEKLLSLEERLKKIEENN